MSFCQQFSTRIPMAAASIPHLANCLLLYHSCRLYVVSILYAADSLTLYFSLFFSTMSDTINFKRIYCPNLQFNFRSTEHEIFPLYLQPSLVFWLFPGFSFFVSFMSFFSVFRTSNTKILSSSTILCHLFAFILFFVRQEFHTNPYLVT